MIGPDYATTMAAYNRWQNEQLLSAADGLDEGARRLERGAFFGSIHATLNHILWGDQIWLHRLASRPAPKAGSIADSLAQYATWDDYKAARRAFDQVLVDWASTLDPAALDGELQWFSGSVGRVVSKPRWLLVTHMFNHQTHHRGQVHAMLTAAGAKLGATDLAFMPES
jgi:uncharacterized damage-inducible protein DinB